MSGLRCLWIARESPFPMHEGAHIYTVELARSLATAGADVTVLSRGDGRDVPLDDVVRWITIDSQPRPAWMSIPTGRPSIADRNATRSQRKALVRMLRDGWDAVILDHIGSAWALPFVVRADCPIVYISHNHEASTRRLMTTGASNFPLRAALRLDARKVAAMEHRVLEQADLLTTNTREDEEMYLNEFPQTRSVVLLPGYRGRVSDARKILPSTPRSVAMVGSFWWLAKRQNLEMLIAAVDDVFHEAGIELVVIGEGPTRWMDHIAKRTRSVRFTGAVRAVEPYLDSCRLGLICEPIGGGFKHKALYYVFSRLPIAATTDSIAGLPLRDTDALLVYNSAAALARGVVDVIDATDRLNELQELAFRTCRRAFDWSTRGKLLLAELHRISSRPT
jgi:polysaccharide biosynthesis protein PslH